MFDLVYSVVEFVIEEFCDVVVCVELEVFYDDVDVLCDDVECLIVCV